VITREGVEEFVFPIGFPNDLMDAMANRVAMHSVYAEIMCPNGDTSWISAYVVSPISKQVGLTEVIPTIGLYGGQRTRALRLAPGNLESLGALRAAGHVIMSTERGMLN